MANPHPRVLNARRDQSNKKEEQGEVADLGRPNKAVIMLQGRYTSRKGVIVGSFDDRTRDHPYGHCLVTRIAKYPKKVIWKDSAKKQAKKSRVECLIKLVNYNPDSLQSCDKKVTVAKEAKAEFKERFKTSKNHWFFTKLRL